VDFLMIRGLHKKRRVALQSACLVVLTSALAIVTGCRQDKQDQPKFFPQRGTLFYADGRSVRPQVAGTVARSQAVLTSYLLTGLVDGKEVDAMTFPVTAEVLARGQERYNIYCSPCHSRVGNDLGMIVQRGYHPAGDFHSLRLRSVPLAHFVNVMSNGYGAMPDYSAQLTPQDRWAVAAYIRVLQLSQHATRADVQPGAEVVPLARLAARNGLSPDFAQPWEPRSATTPSPAPGPPASTSVLFAANRTATPAVTAAGQFARRAAAMAASAQPEAQPSDSHGTRAPVGPAIAQAETAPIPRDKAASSHDVEAGAQIYKRSCSMCHQPNRSGLPPTIPSLIGVVDKVGANHIRSVILTGIPTAVPPMPAFAGSLSAGDISNVVAFLASPK
jgi:mono/diheme cytochrome c family protein